MSTARDAIDSGTTFIDVCGKKTQLMQGGEGPPLVYLHSAAGETEWSRFHHGLAERYTVFAPAHPGFAMSEGLEQIDNIHDMAWHYVDLFDSLGLDVCHSGIGAPTPLESRSRAITT